MEKLKAFLKRKNIVISAKRYGIDALGAMAQGLFCSLLIGTIINTIGTQFHIPFLTQVMQMGSLSVKRITIVTPILTIVLVVILVILIQKTKIGMAMRAVSRDFETSQLMGIKINSVISMTFAIGSFLAGVASILYFANYGQVSPMIGAMPGLKAFVAAVFGGIGSIPGAVIGAFLIGICETIIKGLPSAWNVSVFSDAFTFALLIIILTCKPTGLFGEKATDKV